MKKRMKKLTAAILILCLFLSCVPAWAEEDTGEDAARVAVNLQAIKVMLDDNDLEFTYQRENDTFEELIADPNAKSPEKQISDADSLQRLHEAMTRLDEREREVITLRFFRFKTLEQVSVMINRTRERVRQIQNQALAKMRVVMAEEAEVVNS